MPANILISGCSSGIGRACALHFAGKGYHVFACVRKESDAASLREADTSGNIEPLMLDVTDAAQLDRIAADLTTRLGQQGLAGLINNAGVGTGGPLEFQDPDEVRHTFEVNVMGPLRLSQAFLPLLRKARGRIVTIGSMAGKVAIPLNGSYTISKFGVEAFCDALRQELHPHGVQVALIEPGPIATPMLSGAKEQGESHLARLPPEATQYYGERLAKMLAQVADMERQAPPPAVVVDAVEHALESSRPKARYVVTRDAKVLIFLRWLLPDRALDWMLKTMIA
jgi:NAD(P)-dependent dehydrogenase (short-subunit alcohol dehydrogenase family)